MRLLRELSKKEIKGKIALVRVDLNVKEKKERDFFRIESALSSIRFLLNAEAKIVLLSHSGRPKKKNTKDSLRSFANIFSKKINERVIFLESFDFSKLRWEIVSSSHKIFLLENLRFFSGEEKNSHLFGVSLSSLGDFYVNEAFSVSHRLNTSVSVLPQLLPSYAGFSFEKEVINLQNIEKKEMHPFVVVLGGIKIEDKISLLSAFKNKADFFLLGGGIANTFLAAEDFSVGNSLYDKSIAKDLKPFLSSKKIVLPFDFIISNKKILDIGKMTQKKFNEIILQAKKIVWSGPLGFYHRSQWSSGTRVIWEAIFQNKKASVLIGGGETMQSIKLISKEKQLNLHKRKNIFFSTGGGAMVSFLSKRKMPGIDALK